VPRPMLPQGVTKPVGVTHCQGQVCRGRQLPKKYTGEGSELKLEPQKGGYARSREGTVIGSDQRLGHIPRKYGRESMPGRAAKC
jgi:hypothetical protein